jgi:LPLT family lysophospholipid transporter-like MFS transporter
MKLPRYCWGSQAHPNLRGLQNFNENLSVLLMLGGYALMIRADLPVSAIVVIFGLFVAATMGLLVKIHGHDQD